MDPAQREEFQSRVFALQVPKLLRDAHALRDRSLNLYAKAHLIVQRNKTRVAQTRRLLEARAQRRAARLLQERILEKLVAGLLPDVDAAVVWGAPGVDGRCDACEDVLQPTQVVMSVPWPSRNTFAHLHADCFMAWKAVRLACGGGGERVDRLA